MYDATAKTIFFRRQAEKKSRIVANKIAKTDFLQERHVFINIKNLKNESFAFKLSCKGL
jgi:hypothetical protein